ncbi:MAG TPA: metal ABC transporter ATP-binding protein [Bacillota bacterium]|nr:metal ABC transporter ATP-binding protein [Bacillota bacterium]
MSQISARKISMSYEKKLVLDEVSFDVEAGDYLCIVGENGSGKTTLMKGILGLMPLKSGTIQFGEGVKADQIGYLPQQTVIQKDFPASVFEVALSGCLNRIGMKPFYSGQEKNRALQNLEILGIKNLRYKSYKSLSGGQQQRVLLARALCAAEKVILLDEPATGLDPIVTGELYRIIGDLNDRGVTVIMISHDVRAAVDNANKILHIGDSAEFFGSTEDYLRSEAGKRFLGQDCRAVQEGGGDMKGRSGAEGGEDRA